MHLATQTSELALSSSKLNEVYRLRHACYLRNFAIDPSPDFRFTDRFDALPNHFSFLQHRASQPQSTVRVSVVRPDLGWTDSPARQTFGDHPCFQRFAASSYAEGNRLCFDPQAKRRGFVELLANVAALAEVYDVEWILACPRMEHVHVYQNLFGFQPQAEPRSGIGVKLIAPLMATSLSQLRAYVQYDQRMIEAWQAASQRLRGESVLPLAANMNPHLDSLAQSLAAS